jgi:hypothetical protein
LLSRLVEQQRRWYLAVESQRLGHGTDRLLFEITGVDEKTIRRGREELALSLTDQPLTGCVSRVTADHPSKKSAGDTDGARVAHLSRDAAWPRSQYRYCDTPHAASSSHHSNAKSFGASGLAARTQLAIGAAAHYGYDPFG